MNEVPGVISKKSKSQHAKNGAGSRSRRICVCASDTQSMWAQGLFRWNDMPPPGRLVCFHPPLTGLGDRLGSYLTIATVAKVVGVSVLTHWSERAPDINHGEANKHALRTLRFNISATEYPMPSAPTGCVPRACGELGAQRCEHGCPFPLSGVPLRIPRSWKSPTTSSFHLSSSSFPSGASTRRRKEACQCSRRS